MFFPFAWSPFYWWRGRGEGAGREWTVPLFKNNSKLQTAKGIIPLAVCIRIFTSFYRIVWEDHNPRWSSRNLRNSKRSWSLPLCCISISWKMFVFLFPTNVIWLFLPIYCDAVGQGYWPVIQLAASTMTHHWSKRMKSRITTWSSSGSLVLVRG